MIKNTSKTIIIIGVIICCLIGLIAVMVFVSNNKNKTEQQITLPEKTEAEIQAENEGKALLEANREAMQKAKQQIYQPVKEINKEDHILGDIDAPVQLIIYNDFNCPFFARLNETIEQVKQEFGNKIVIAFRHFPQRIHSHAMIAALAAECAAEQDKFWQMHDKLLADNRGNKMSIGQFKQDAVDIGLDAAKFNQCLETKKYQDKISAQMSAGKDAGAIGTPTIFVNGEQIAGAAPFEDYVALDGVDEEGMKSVIERHLGEDSK